VFEATRYHSLVVDAGSVPDCLEVTAWTGDGIVMGLRHRSLPIEGVQFHPESILTGAAGHDLLGNFLELAGEGVSA
jgi:anthranilate synthase component 2